MPPGLDESDAAYWRAIMSAGPHLAAHDADMMLSCVQLRRLYLAAHAEAMLDPLDVKSRGAVLNYHERWQRAIAMLAIDPLGRKRAGVSESPADDPLGELGIVG